MGDRAPLPDRVAAEQAVLPSLPFHGTASEVALFALGEAGGRWSRRAAFPLSRR